MVYKLIKKVLFKLDAERAHTLVAGLGKHSQTVPGMAWIQRSLYQYTSERLHQKLLGLDFNNPVGMAAGFDKAGDLYPFLSNMGFGFIESGTFTAQAQPGNPRPRLFRYPEQQALINRMGFNNAGSVDVQKLIRHQRRTVPRGINIGKSKVTELSDAPADYLLSLERLAEYSDYIAVNVSSPNTPGLRELQSEAKLRELLGALKQAAIKIEDTYSRRLPLLVKLAPDMELSDLDQIIALALDLKLDGIILTNTTLDHKAIDSEDDQTGGLSGRPVRDKGTAFIRHAWQQSAGQLLIIGVGGIADTRDAIEKICAGASLIQIYTGYIYQGPGLLARINKGIDTFLRKEGLASISDLVGSKAQD